MSNNATASASALAVNIAAGLAGVIMQVDQSVYLGGQSNNGAAVGLLMRSNGGLGAVGNHVVNYATVGNGMIGIRLADNLVAKNIFYAPVFNDDFGIDAVAGAGNVVQLGKMSSPVGAYDHIPEVLLGRTVGITSQQ